MVACFQVLVHKWWMEIAPEGYGAFIFSKNLSHLRGHLRHWAKFCFGFIKLRTLWLLHKLEALDIANESRCLTSSKANQQQELRERLVEIHNQEEIY